MKKILLSLFYLFVFSLSLIANPVGKEKAMEIARNFLGQMSPHKMNMVERPINKTPKRGYNQDDVPFYIINNEDGGFVIVSNSTSTVPILAYSYRNTFNQESVPDNLSEWMEHLSEAINKGRNYAQTPRVLEAWKSVTNKQINASSPVVKMETALWNQGPPFNNQCPEVNGKRCVTGCVATALAIVMRYWKWPSAGVGTLPKYSYNPENGDGYDPDLGWIEGAYHGGGYELGEEYDWDAMPLDNYEQFNESQQQAVSHLMKDCGALLKTTYTNFGSGAVFYQTENIKEFFNYDKAFTKQCAVNFSYNEWTTILKRELNDGRPILASGGLHAYVIDGYDDNDFFSINWGWGGQDNGYYIMDPYYTNNWSGGDIYTFFITQEAFIGLQPNAGGEYKYILEWYGGDKYLSIPANHFELSKPFELCNVYASIRDYPSGSFYRGDYAAAIMNQSGELKTLISTPESLYGNWCPLTISCQINEAPDPGDYITIVFRSVGTSTWESVLANAYSNNAKLYLNESEKLDDNTTILVNPNERQFTRGLVSLTTKLMTIKTMTGTAITVYRSDGSIVPPSGSRGWLQDETDEEQNTSTFIHYLFLSNFEPGTYTIVLNHSLQHKEITFTL